MKIAKYLELRNLASELPKGAAGPVASPAELASFCKTGGATAKLASFCKMRSCVLIAPQRVASPADWVRFVFHQLARYPRSRLRVPLPVNWLRIVKPRKKLKTICFLEIGFDL